jgi:hypothetical protein
MFKGGHDRTVRIMNFHIVVMKRLYTVALQTFVGTSFLFHLSTSSYTVTSWLSLNSVTHAITVKRF